MGDPFTREKCEICGNEFDMPMERSRRGGWAETESSLSLMYRENYEIEFESVCDVCYKAIYHSIEEAIEHLKRTTKIMKP